MAVEIFQLDFFDDPETSRLEAKIVEVRGRGDRVRKSTFARINVLTNEVMALREELEFLKKCICKGKT